MRNGLKILTELWGRSNFSIFFHDLQCFLHRQRLNRSAAHACHGLGGKERIEDGFLCGFYGGQKERGDVVVAQYGLC